MAVTCRMLLLQLVCLAALLNVCFGSYVITTPRKWTPGETTQVCVVLLNATSDSPNEITVQFTTEYGWPVLLEGKVIRIPEGEKTMCERIFLPEVSYNSLLMEVTGTLTDEKINYKKKITCAKGITKTFIQTDKLIYKPGQDVQFRILTVVGPYLQIFKRNYMVWIETPSGSRIAQWTNVDNSAGLVHLAFKLADEPEEGLYTIKVRPSVGGSPTRHTFKVEEYVLPRFEVSVHPPKCILSTDTDLTFTVCAKYSFGQPVTGNVTLEIENCSTRSCKTKHVIRDKISGCKELKVLSDELPLNYEDFFVAKLAAKATVVEEGTGQEFKADATANVQREVVKFTNVGKEEFMKPNLPFTEKIKASRADCSPAIDELVEVCYGRKCKNMTTGPEGILEFVVPNYSSAQIKIRAVNYPEIRPNPEDWLPIMVASDSIQFKRKYFSPSNSALVIRVPEDRLPCSPDGHKLTLPVLFSAVNQSKALVAVQVVSRGQIQFSSAEEYEFSPSSLPIKEEHLIEPLPPTPQHTIIGVLNIPLTLPRSVSPSAKVLVWYTRPDGEIVSDTQVINIEKCFENDVNLEWSSAKVFPGAQATLDLSASPNSLCSLGVVDKSVELLSSQTNEITLGKVFGILENVMVKEWENSQSSDKIFCRTRRGRRHAGKPDPREPLAETPALDLERSAIVKRSFLPILYLHVDASKMFDKSGLYILTNLTTETRPCTLHFEYLKELEKLPYAFIIDPDALEASQQYDVSGGPDSGGEVDFDAHQQRTYFPETWLWKIKMVNASGVLSEQYTLPDTITEWVGNAVCVSPDTGLGISQRTAITTFTPFFVDLTLPPSIKRGEILPVKISVFNYLHQALPVRVILEESTEYEILQETDNQLPLGHRIACIPTQQKVVHTVKIRSLVLGKVNITVDAFVDELYPESCGPEYVLSKRDVLIKPIKVEAEGFPREKTWTKYICSNDIIQNADFFENWKIELPSVIVQDSARGWVTATGDLLGPTLENLGSLVKMPYGCGEQNMLNFAPNIFILQYLEASNQTTPEIVRKVTEYMEQGYQRELQYRHRDGSFSAFGSSDASGSTWLTAFVLKSFAQARQYIQVDKNDLGKSRHWLGRKRLENGCFQSVGNVLHKGMKGGIDGSSSPAPLTSYALIALLESGGLTTSKVVMDAVKCLHAHTSRDPYTLALKAYALALSETPEANQALQNLLSVATESSNSLYWDLPAGSGKSEAVAVETAGYAILAMMTLDANLYGNQAKKIVKWISSQRNGQGGFISTQDTVVALQALASFEAHQREPVNLMVMVQAEGVEHAFSIVESNTLLQQQVNLPSIPTNVILDMEGQGCSLVQAVLRYNVPEASASDAFALSVTTETVPDKKCVTKKIKACASYSIPNDKSNMAVMEFNLVSGYIPYKADLKEIVGNGTGLLKRYEVDGSKVDFYIDELSRREICVQFQIIREVDVEDAKPATVKVYDYYQPEFSVSKTYVLPPPDDCQNEVVPIEALTIEGEIIPDD